ncbi:hypothetical protein [Ulvibacter antarcticus]|uniref:TonB family protein n=1 Tax=Ulvibacter antarcticus TaxID=442714 RepID=A0A3L9Z037_9FLAO|nr:hypothetical protein [Ulvibacter antarcticus]RMA66331.1 hypothetical protein BXY75_0753 [Ulvibacter antarcticus]
MLFGILFLAFKSINLSKYEYVNEENFDIEFSEEDIIPEDEIAAISKRDINVETNRAFNEAEKFISELEKDRLDPNENQDGQKQEAQNSETNSDGDAEGSKIVQEKKKVSEEKKEISNGRDKNKEIAKSTSSKRNSTVSYRLVNRNQLYLPNPVYTCGNYGKVVINIEVNALGKVTKATYNDTSSTTKNECLIDSALEYARQAIFTTASDKIRQLGSITYNFQGQD